MLAVKILLIVSAVAVGLFLLSWVIYFFNLDMKFAALMTPVMIKFYDRKKRKKENKDKVNKDKVIKDKTQNEEVL